MEENTPVRKYTLKYLEVKGHDEMVQEDIYTRGTKKMYAHGLLSFVISVY